MGRDGQLAGAPDDPDGDDSRNSDFADRRPTDSTITPLAATVVSLVLPVVAGMIGFLIGRMGGIGSHRLIYPPVTASVRQYHP